MNRTIRLASVAVAATSVVALGATFRASASTTPGDAGAASKAAQAALRYVTANPPATNQAVPGVRHGVRGLTQFYSTNWSGYANNNSGGNTYSNVSAHWTQPAITCPTKEEQLAAFWVGIDGYTSNTVEQAGTLAQCFEGTAHYYNVVVDGMTNENAAWYYPEPKAAAAEIKDHVAFWKGVRVEG